MQKLLQGYETLKPEFDDALNKDLGLNPFMSNLLSHSITIAYMKDIHDHFEQWAQVYDY